jgi:hypothetical protein
MADDVRHIVRDRRLRPREIEHYRELRAKLDSELPDIKALARALRDRQQRIPPEEMGPQDNQHAG